jgi:large subunit ribosomal protein L32
MAIVPQRRTGKTRKNRRRSHLALDLPGMMACPNCGEMKLSHNICPACGYYDGKQVITIKVKSEVEEEAKATKKETKAKAVPAEVKGTKKPAKKVEVNESMDAKKQTRSRQKTTSQA